MFKLVLMCTFWSKEMFSFNSMLSICRSQMLIYRKTQVVSKTNYIQTENKYQMAGRGRKGRFKWELVKSL